MPSKSSYPRRACCVAGALTALLAPALQAQDLAANYGDITGDTVIYRNVFETGDALLNAPVISGDRLAFQPLGSAFQTSSFGGDPGTIANNVATVLVARPGNALDHVTVTAGGELDLRDLGRDATSLTSVQAEVTLTATVIDYIDPDGNVSFGNTVDLAPMTTTLSQVAYAVAEQTSLAWGGAATLDFATRASAEAGIDGLLLRVGITVNTTLRAFSEDTGTFSRISLRNFDAITLTTVPEPTSAALVFAAVAPALLRRRR